MPMAAAELWHLEAQGVSTGCVQSSYFAFVQVNAPTTLSALIPSLRLCG
jgi:hypothetical protein